MNFLPKLLDTVFPLNERNSINSGYDHVGRAQFIVRHMKQVLSILFLLLLSSCTGSFAYLSYGKSVADIFSFFLTDKTTTEHGMDLITGQDCKFLYALEGKNLMSVCKETTAIVREGKNRVQLGHSSSIQSEGPKL